VTPESIPGRFAQAVARHPARTAVSAPAGQWTYAELDRRSHSIAANIVERSGDTAGPVALLMEHDAPLIAAILGTLRANQMYLALDPSHPAQQLAAMLAGSGAKLMLADQANLALAQSLVTGHLQIIPVTENIPGHLPGARFPEISGDAGAWLMFTSGSTSAPKGVWQNHRGIVHEAEVYARLAGLTPDDHVSLLASCGLSASGATIFAALLNGAALCLFPLRSQGVERLADWLPRERITIFHSVPTVFRHLARAAEKKNSFAGVRLIRLGGEPVLAGDLELFRRLGPDHCRLVQSLSSTETGLICTFTLDKQTRLPGPRVPAGHAVSGVEVFLVDDNNQPLKSGGEGKIAVRSARLRQGYWRQPERTAEKFLADADAPGMRVFISNDLGKFLPDGSLEHLGRADQLVKIRGQRVDLGEVEAALLAAGLATEAVVIAQEDESGEKRLAAYLVPRAGAEVSAQHLRKCLLRQLPEHMVPNDFVPLERLPQTAAGKIDRHALPQPATRTIKKSLTREQSPRNAIDRRLTGIWETVLNLSPISRTDDFFELGGTSLQSVEVLLHIEEVFDVSLPPSTLVEYSTIDKLAGLLSDRAAIPPPNPLVKLRDGQGGHPLFLIHTGQGDVTSFGLLARRLPNRPIYGLQSIGLRGDSWPLMSVPAMARRYLPEILAKDPTGPYLLAGACMGGLVALELSQMLVQQGRQVGLLALLDTPHPLRRWQQPGWKEKLYCPARDTVKDSLRILRWAILRASGLGRRTRWLAEYRRFVANMNFRASRFYRPKPYPGTITLFLAGGKNFATEDRRLLLRPYAQDSTVITIPTGHIGLFVKPAVNDLARQLQTCLESAEKKNPP
jgi:amino acid adenylation domain-containing protein